jgi:hypothetical protein
MRWRARGFGPPDHKTRNGGGADLTAMKERPLERQ